MGNDKIQNIFRQYKSNKEIFHDLMKKRVREILLVATVYDSFILEQEGQLSEKIYTEYYDLNLSTAPKITAVYKADEALQLLENKDEFDLVILMMRIDGYTPFQLSEKINEIRPDTPILLLLNDNNDIRYTIEHPEKLEFIDRTFVWHGSAKIFLAMIKYIEDKMNVDKDTEIGLVRIILLVEDSPKYYSKYLPDLYVEIMLQTQRLISDERLDEFTKRLRMRARPKVLIAQDYDQAIEIFTKYKDYMLSVISDVKYPKDKVLDENAGLKLTKFVKTEIPDIPVLLQSSDHSNAPKAYKLKASFINKNSDSLALDLKHFILNNLGFGDFIFRDEINNYIGKACSMEEFENKIKNISEESLLYHGARNHFSAWLMARGEIQFAKRIQPMTPDDFQNAEELRRFILDILKKLKQQKTKGKIIPFDESVVDEDIHIVRLAPGSLGGKGRGISFINNLLEKITLQDHIPEVNIRIPKTAVIGTDEFSNFIESNNLHSVIYNIEDYENVKRLFLSGSLSHSLKEKLKKYLKHIKVPLAVRSSGLFEDSLSQPFSGIYNTFLIPNNHNNFEVRLDQLMDAVKLVFSSVFSPSSRAYFDAVNFKIEDEKMAVVIQEVVGNEFNKKFYPHFSGVAQSYNYYPISYMKPEDGISVLALGLGKYVVEGENAFRFCPKYQKIDILTKEEQLDNSQDHFYAIDMNQNSINLSLGEDITLKKTDIEEAEKDDTLNYIASVWDYQNNRMQVGLSCYGPRVLNFAYILKYNYIPLAKIVELLLDIVKTAIGTPAEIEFAVDLSKKINNKPTFYILQIKPLVRNSEKVTVNTSNLKKDELFLYTEKGMGNGIINDVRDIIYVDPNKFDKSKTFEMASEIEKLNKKMIKEDLQYILIGPGRWGTRDKWLGIPIIWPQISNAKIIVEADLKDFRIDASLGSHFFHNVTSLNIGYFTIPFKSDSAFIDWDWIKKLDIAEETEFFVHAKCREPFEIVMDGRKSISLIYKNCKMKEE